MRSRPTVSLVVIAIGVAAILATTSLSAGFSASLNGVSQRLTPFRTCTVTATPSSTTAVLDTAVRQATPTTNLGTQTTMDVSSANAANRRIYVKFDLSGCSPTIPASATVRQATLRLYATTLPAACRTLDIFRATATWAESVTWNTQPFGTTINNPATGSRTDSFDVGTPVGCENRVAGYITGANVTSDVEAYVAGSATNHGWMIRDDAEGAATARTSIYSTKNLGTLSRAPQLVVTYVTVP